MPCVRFRKWRYLTALAPYTSDTCASGRRYCWTGADEGIVEVPYKADVEDLLNPFAPGPSEFEIAWERHGVAFDAQGRELRKPCLPGPSSPPSPTTDRAGFELTGSAKPRGRPPKR